MESEIEYQLEDLPLLGLSEPHGNCLFVGSGDSYAASLAAQHASRHRALSCHPLDLVENPCIADGRVVYFVSVSGRTRANILAAKAAKKRGVHTIAVTARPDSPLALYCDEVIHTKYRHSLTTTPGTISFTANLITCLSLTVNVKLPKSIAKVLAVAEKQAEDIVGAKRSARKSYFLLGNGVFFPIALYGAMKLYEITGARAFAYPAEEFCHSPLFSITKKDAILILGEQTADLTSLAKRLVKEGFDSTFVQVSDDEILDAILHSTFFLQMFSLKLAQKLKLKECYFLRNKKLLRISSDFIYG